MSKKRICLIAQFPPPLHGLSKAVDTLYKSKQLRNQFDFIKVDITNNKKFFSNYSIIKNTDADLFYLTISQSIFGNIRDLLVMRLLRKQGKKLVIHLHGGFFRKLYNEKMNGLQKLWNRIALKSVSGAIVLGDSLKYIFDGLVDQDKIHVVPNCVDNEFLISDVDLQKKIENPDNTYHILYLSNLIRSKGFDIVLEMAKEYKNSPGGKKLHFDFAGKFYEDVEREFFDGYVKKYHLEDVVTNHGIVTGNKKRSLLKNSTFFALPTTYPKEGQPISILEAMGNGLVILTTNHAGIPDIVQNGKNGCVVDCEKAKTKLYLHYIDDLSKAQIDKISVNNYKEVKDCFLENTYVFNLARVFSSIIDNK